jgi:hypothetical protein
VVDLEVKREITCTSLVSTIDISGDWSFVDLQTAYEEQICVTLDLLLQANGVNAKVARVCLVEVAHSASSLHAATELPGSALIKPSTLNLQFFGRCDAFRQFEILFKPQERAKKEQWLSMSSRSPTEPDNTQGFT